MAKQTDVRNAFIVGAVLVLGAVFLVQGDLFAIGDEPSKEKYVTTAEAGTSGIVSLPKAASSGTVTLFKKSNVDEPDNWDNFVDFTLSDAKQGLEQSVDYLEETSVSSDTVTFTGLPAGDYYLYVEDSNFHNFFAEVSMPGEITEWRAENNNKEVLNSANNLDTVEVFGTENIVFYDSEGSVLGTGTTMPAPISNGTQTFEVVRSIAMDTGVAYLGDYEVTSFNDGDGIENVNLEIVANGETYTEELKDGSSGELADSTSFGEDLKSSIETDPLQTQDTIKVTYTIKADVNTLSGSTGDSELNDGETILTSGMDDIYGDSVSTATNTFTR